MKIIVRKESEKMKGTALIEYCGNGMYRYIDCDGNEHILREPIRCKDCKYFSQNDRWCERYECGEGCGSICWDLGEDGFCSKAEERIYCKDCKYFKVGKCYWRGDFEEAEKMNGVKIIREYPQPTNMNDWCGNGEKR